MSKLVVYVLSDSIGETGELMARAVLSQFDLQKYEIKREPFITSQDQIDEVLSDAKIRTSVIFYTLVLRELSEYVEKRCKNLDIQCVDLMTGAMEAIRSVVNMSPKYEAGIIRKFDDNYFRKVEAIEFAVKYDDGKDPRGIKKSDIVLIGISRTSKTPLSMYMAHHNFKVANVPLVPEVEPPKELFQKDGRRIIGLIANPMKLNEIRQERLKSLGLDNNASYANMKRIEEELEYSKSLMQRLKCMIIDVSYKAIEETAGIIMQYIQEEFEDDKYVS